MSRHLVWLVLAISVVFNVGFAASYLTAQSSAPTDPAQEATADADPVGAPGATGDSGTSAATDDRDDRRARRPGPDGRGGRDGRIGQVVGMLQLDEDQQAYFRGLYEGMAEDEAIFSVAIGALRQQLAGAYEADDADVEAVRALHEREAELLRQRRLARAERLEAFMAVLRPQQLEVFRGLVERSWNRERPEMTDRMAEFDADGDGQLDENEIATLRSGITERIRERTEARIENQRQTRERFDTDGDGRLDRSEREAARRWEIIRRYDADGDGELDEQEQAALERDRASLRERLQRGRGGRGGPGGPGGPEGGRRGERGDRGERGERPDEPDVPGVPATDPGPGG